MVPPLCRTLKAIDGWWYRFLARRAELGRLRYFLIFVGNHRSGTTLVRALLDGHPNVVIGNEVNALARFLAGESWMHLAGRILHNSAQFARDPVWTGYNYQLPKTPTEKLFVLGDKKAGITTDQLIEHADSLSQFIEWLPVPLRIVHCVRHPFDVIATITRRTNTPLEYNIERYFQRELTISRIFNKLRDIKCHRIYHEGLIYSPEEVITGIFSFLELEVTQPLMEVYRSKLYKQPNLSRFDVDWSPSSIARVWQQALQFDHMKFYLDERTLSFNRSKQK